MDGIQARDASAGRNETAEIMRDLDAEIRGVGPRRTASRFRSVRLFLCVCLFFFSSARACQDQYRGDTGWFVKSMPFRRIAE